MGAPGLHAHSLRTRAHPPSLAAAAQDPTGEIFDATSLLISALIRHVDADVKTTNLQRVQQGLSPYPDIARVWTMRASPSCPLPLAVPHGPSLTCSSFAVFFKRDSRVLTSLVKKRGFQYLEDYLADHPEVPREQVRSSLRLAHARPHSSECHADASNRARAVPAASPVLPARRTGARRLGDPRAPATDDGRRLGRRLGGATTCRRGAWQEEGA